MIKVILVSLISLTVLAENHVGSSNHSRSQNAGRIENSFSSVTEFLQNFIASNDTEIRVSEPVAVTLGLRGRGLTTKNYVFKYPGVSVSRALLDFNSQPAQRPQVIAAVADITLNLFVWAVLTAATDREQAIAILANDRHLENMVSEAVLNNITDNHLKLEIIAAVFDLKRNKAHFLERIGEVFGTVMPNHAERESFEAKVREYFKGNSSN